MEGTEEISLFDNALKQLDAALEHVALEDDTIAVLKVSQGDTFLHTSYSTGRWLPC